MTDQSHASAERRTYIVAGMTCGHCVEAVSTEVGAVAGVANVQVDLASKHVIVSGTALDDAAIHAAVDEAGYEAVLIAAEP